MALLDLWKNNRDELKLKHVQQLIAIAGEGKLLDGNSASVEFRDLLSVVPSSLLRRCVQQCLDDKFDASGFALQDLVNQVGLRLGFEVEYGRYRGQKGQYGHDGLWSLRDGHRIVIEVKTTDAYAINLDTVASYRKRLAMDARAVQDETSLLLVVGRQDTGGLEAQIRGSRYAWDMRIISADGLLRLMELKETLDDPAILSKISSILLPQEYTKLDQIIDIVFATAEEVASAEATEDDEAIPEDDTSADTTPGKREPKFRPVKFHEECASRVEKHLNISLVKKSRSLYSTPDASIQAWIAVSKQHGREGKEVYWFAIHPHQKEALEQADDAYAVLGCASAETLFIIPYTKLREHLDKMWTTERDDRMYWHVKVEGAQGRYFLLLRHGEDNPEISSCLVRSETARAQSD